MTGGSSWSACKVFGAALVVQQNTFYLYHRNSYANNPAMLRSPKPLIMRDLFLTKRSYIVGNPLSVLYVPRIPEMISNCVTAAVFGLGLPLVSGIGPMFAVWVIGGFASSTAWLFQAKVNKQRLNSEYDVTASSNGGWCAVATFSLFFKGARIPVLNAPMHYFSLLYVMWALCDEYVIPRLLPDPPNVARVHNGGVFGGIFTGLIIGTVFVRRKIDVAQAQRFVSNVSAKVEQQPHQQP